MKWSKIKKGKTYKYKDNKIECEVEVIEDKSTKDCYYFILVVTDKLDSNICNGQTILAACPKKYPFKTGEFINETRNYDGS